MHGSAQRQIIVDAIRRRCLGIKSGSHRSFEILLGSSTEFFCGSFSLERTDNKFTIQIRRFVHGNEIE
jgi:hypothetical protein